MDEEEDDTESEEDDIRAHLHPLARTPVGACFLVVEYKRNPSILYDRLLAHPDLAACAHALTEAGFSWKLRPSWATIFVPPKHMEQVLRHLSAGPVVFRNGTTLALVGLKPHHFIVGAAFVTAFDAIVRAMPSSLQVKATRQTGPMFVHLL